MTKILHILDHSIPVTDGYSVRSQNIIRIQAELGLEPVVVTSSRQVDKYNAASTKDVEIIDGIRYYRSATSRESRLPFVPEIQRLRRMTARIEEVVDIERPDILHSHSPCLWGLATARAARRRGIPFVYEIRGFWEDAIVDSGKATAKSIRYRLMRAMETRVCRLANVVTTIADGLKADLVQRGIDPDTILITPNGVETDRFRPLEPDKKLIAELGMENCVLVGYIGSLFAWEGVEDLVRAVPEIIRHTPQSRILIVGGGEQEKMIGDLIRQLKLDNYVKSVGKVPHADIARYYSIIDVLVYPRKSTRNTELCTPLKPLEAMAMEKAVIGSNVGGIRELLADGTGLQHLAGDPSDLAVNCIRLITDPSQRECLGREARSHVVSTRDWKILASRYLDVYSAAAAACGRPIAKVTERPEPKLAEIVATNNMAK